MGTSRNPAIIEIILITRLMYQFLITIVAFDIAYMIINFKLNCQLDRNGRQQSIAY